jgi:hypothetical protein
MRLGFEIRFRDPIFGLMEKGNDMITESSRGSSLGEAFQANRLPLALIGVGVAWLLASNTGLANRVVQDERVQAARRRIGEIAGDIGIGGSSAPEDHAARGERILGPDGEPLSRSGDAGRRDGWVHQAAGAARGAVSSVRDASSAVLDRAGKYTDYAGNASDMAKRAGGQLSEKLERDPWLIGVAGLVAGALVAALLPPTRVEQEYVGEARDDLWNKATQLGHDAAERVRELADATTRAPKH